MDKLDEMTYLELFELKIEVKRRLKGFRPIRIKKKWKRCGKAACFCSDGPGDGSWGNLHGPYLIAQFVDHTTRRTRNVSLGKFYGLDEWTEARDRTLNFFDYFHLNPDQYEALGQADKDENRWCINLTARQFEIFYNISRADDRLGRHGKFYGTQANYEAYEMAGRALAEAKQACDHVWATEYGLASPAGQRALADLLRQGYYLKEI